ncbi:hypothetical protein HHL23_19005 [Chryseobacterium sp. RP-3-3]|uniref:Uncharacterized protein n=1 Tax=Chryseobacterium antibioticum TaxID=2728847 RepID=A0A7Y0AQY2_9FLAO|nr:hypothetical protein [Chryseobacterium antibioticum]NML71868.1 hypothetical protein [Chryseobacterium antibioticum]
MSPLRYNIQADLIDLKIIQKEKDELFIRFKIVETLLCDFKDISNCNLKYKVLTYNEETDSYEKKVSQIEFKFSDGKGKINIQHPDLSELLVMQAL